jgi:hypothetical protein
MTELIYETPTKSYTITKETDAQWQELFGRGFGWYVISKKDDPDFCRSEITLDKAFRWLWNRQVISKDEMLFKISELCKGDDDEATEASSTAE